MLPESNNQIEHIEKEIAEHNAAIAKLKRLIPLGILTMSAFGLGLPLLPGKRTHKTLSEDIGYPYAAGLYLLLGFGVYIWGYRTAVRRRKTKISELKNQLQNL